MELRYLLVVLRTYARFIVTAALVAGALGLAATYVLPEKYEASTTLLIRPRREPALEATSKAMMDYPVSYNIPVDSMSKTYSEIMRSDAVATRVVDQLHLDTLKRPPDPRWWMRTIEWTRDHARLAMLRSWEFVRYGRLEAKDPYWEAVGKVQDGLAATPLTDTYLFSLSASASDPALATRIADTAATVFVDYTRQARMREEDSGADDIGRRLSSVRADLQAARARLSGFGDGTSAASLDRELQLEVEALAGFRTEREQTVSRLKALNAEVEALSTQMARLSATVPTDATRARNPVVVELEATLARDEVELAGLAETHQPAHPRMKELEAEIEETKARLAGARPVVDERTTSARNPLRDTVEARLLDRTATRDAQRAHLASMDASAAKYQQELAALTGQKADLARLTLDVEVRENEYRLVSQQYAEARLASVFRVAEVRVLHTAVPPVYPVRPIKIYYVAAGLALGFLSALMAVLLFDYADPRVRTLDGFAALPGTPVLAVVPHAPDIPLLLSPAQTSGIPTGGGHA